jgi:hypothetical protein
MPPPPPVTAIMQYLDRFDFSCLEHSLVRSLYSESDSKKFILRITHNKKLVPRMQAPWKFSKIKILANIERK